MQAYKVEVFPLAADRWIALVWDENGEFVIDLSAGNPGEIVGHVESELVNYLSGGYRLFFVDDEGNPWSSELAYKQLLRFGY